MFKILQVKYSKLVRRNYLRNRPIVSSDILPLLEDIAKTVGHDLIVQKSPFLIQDMEEGEEFTLENLRSICRAYGLPPKYRQNILGKMARRPLKQGTHLNWEAL